MKKLVHDVDRGRERAGGLPRELAEPERGGGNRAADRASSDYTLYGDTLGPAGSDGATYVAMEEANADAVVRGFTGGQRGCG